MMEPRALALSSHLSRRQAVLLGVKGAVGAGLLAAAETAHAAPAAPSPVLAPATPDSDAQDADPALRDLGEHVRTLMALHQVPGVAIGLLLDGRAHAAGWGVTN